MPEPEDVRVELRTMRKYGRYYAMFLSPDRAPTQQLQEILAILLSLEMTTSYPLLLRVFEAYQTEQFSEEDLLECLKVVESVSVMRSVGDVPTNAYNKLFL